MMGVDVMELFMSSWGNVLGWCRRFGSLGAGVAWLVVVSCADEVREEQAVVDPGIEDFGGARVLEPSLWRSDSGSFQDYLAEVQTGWKREKLLEYAGEPDERGEDGWVYRWERYPGMGGEYAEARFWFVDGRVGVVDFGKGRFPRRYGGRRGF